MARISLLMLLCVFTFSAEANTKSGKKTERGLMPELRLTQDEKANEAKAMASEIVITRMENKAIETLQTLIKRKKGTAEEADLQFRLAEMYMKRSKSGRFFDLHQQSPSKQFSSFPIPNETGAKWLREAAQVFFKIEKQFPKFSEMDAVLFNNAFAHQQLNLRNVSETLYRRLQANHPSSPLILDATVALGELLYDQKKFAPALTEFLKIEKYPDSRVFSYAMYKAAWSYYNNQQSDEAMDRMILVINSNPPLKEGQSPNNKHHLRREALRDVAIFSSDTKKADEIFPFLAKITSGAELDESIRDVAKIYSSHSRHKDLNIFLGQYIKKGFNSPMTVEAHLYLVEANESLKDRNMVLKHLNDASDLCDPASKYFRALTAEQSNEVCQGEFRKQSLDLASRWWDIWLKNKSHAEFSGLTEKAFRLILKNEDPAQPDFKTRFALAELNFQLKQYLEASKNYQTASDQSTDPSIKHNAHYGALFSIEKYIATEKLDDKKKKQFQEAQLKLALSYVVAFPKGEHIEEVRLQSALLTYTLGQVEEAVKLTEGFFKPSLKKKENIIRAQDLYLDLLNHQKKYTQLQKEAEKFQQAAAPERKTQLVQISQEANLAYINTLSDSGKKLEAASELKKFSETHKSSKFAKDAQWDALSIFYSEGARLEGAQMAEAYAKENPQDPRSIEALKEAAYTYSIMGKTQKSADILLQLAQKDSKNQRTYQRQAADFYMLDKSEAPAKKIYLALLDKADRQEASELSMKLLEIARKNNDAAEIKKAQDLILNKGYEPGTTQIMIARAEDLFEKKNYQASFELALKANGRDVTALVRAPARVLQARILEKELVQQSVKAKLDRLATVLSLKTEKLDKAHTAYLAAAKMTNDEAIRIQALEGIDRIYGHYIASLENLPMPEGLSEQDQAGLKKELSTLLAPIKDRKLENEGQLAAMKKTQSSTSYHFANLLLIESVKPLIHYPTPEQFKPRFSKAVPGLKDQAKLSEAELQKALTESQFKSLNKTQQALFYSFVAESQTKTEKALWLVEAQLKEDSKNAELLYQRLRLVYKLDRKVDQIFKDIDQVLAMQITSPELKAFDAVRAYSKGDLDLALKNFNSLSIQEVYNFNVAMLMSETLAMKGQVDRAVSMMQDQNRSKQNSFESLLQEAHLLESYKKAGKNSVEAYKKALKLATEPEAKEWLQAKIEYLNTTNTVSSTVSPVGSY